MLIRTFLLFSVLSLMLLAQSSAPSSGPLHVDGAVMVGLLLHTEEAHLPANVQEFLHPKIHFDIRVGEDGCLVSATARDLDPKDVHVVAALHALERWKWRPYLLQGHPVPVSSDAIVSFTDQAQVGSSFLRRPQPSLQNPCALIAPTP